MASISSISAIDLTPLPGKQYFNCEREWREEFIYFLLIDRFHDDTYRLPIIGPARSFGINVPDNAFYGGNLRGITRQLDYIAGLGCTTIWLSPCFENNPNAYHGYNINNYLDIDPHFGSKQDLIELVDQAHARNMRIVLDVVINHSGDNWFYEGEGDSGSVKYFQDQLMPFGGWRREDRPIPIELRDENLYHRKGAINDSGWDSYPENQHGDPYTLKDFENDDDGPGSALINILIKTFCYWIREADIDGFRVDAIKHMGELACARFCSNVREYAYALGKRGFFLFGELAVSDDDIYNRYIGSNTSRMDGNKTVFFGINSLLDFRLAKGDNDNAGLRDVILGNAGPETLFNRLEAQANRALNRGEIGRYLVTFIDNHDNFWQPHGRFGAQANDAQIVAGVGFLLCALGTPCIYYGTEQGFSGSGGDNQIRESMFDLNNPGANLQNPDSWIYMSIAAIAKLVKTYPPLRFGRMYYRPISGDGIHFGMPFGNEYTLAFSRILYSSEVLIAYNVSSQPRQDFILVDADIHPPGSTMKMLYGGNYVVPVLGDGNGNAFVQLFLNGQQFVVLG
ncbi:MAG: alpha-amylase family glycosyl hydrolase [Chitinophagaceae bacterium]